MFYDVSDYPILDADELLTLPAVRAFCKDLPLICNEDIARRNWTQSGPAVLRSFHGTTHSYTTFDIRRSSHENFVGQAIYLTSSHYDCVTNYATAEGPDLQSQVEREAERLADLIAEDPEAYHCYDDSADGIESRARHLAEARLIGDHERVLEVLVRVERPFIISPERSVASMPVFPGLDDLREEARRDTCLDHDIDPDDQDAQEDIQDLIYEAMDAAEAQAHDQLQMAFLNAINDLADPDMRCRAELAIDTPISELTTQELWQLIKDNEHLMDATDEEGQTIHCSIITRMALHLGFDSILLLHANKQFSRMVMDHETTHVHLLDNPKDEVLLLDPNLRAAQHLQAA